MTRNKRPPVGGSGLPGDGGAWNPVVHDEAGAPHLRPWPRPRYGERYISKTRRDGASVEQIVRLDREAFAAEVVPGAGARLCRMNHIVGRSVVGVRSAPKHCDTWSCADCAAQRVARHLGHLHHVISAYDVAALYVTEFDEDLPISAGAVRQSLRRTECETAHGHPAWWMTVRRDDGRVAIVSTGRPVGSLGILADRLPPALTFERVQTSALALPGVVQAPTYPQGLGPDATTGGFVVYVPNATPDQARDFLAELDEMAQDVHSTPFALLDGEAQDELAGRLSNRRRNE